MAYELIETIELALSASSIEFTSIPQDGVDLVLKLSGRSDRSAASDGVKMELNSSSSNFSRLRLNGNGANVAATSSSDNFAGQSLPAASGTSNTFSNVSFYISNYTDAVEPKSISIDSVSEENGTTAFQDLISLAWAAAASITSITLVTTNAQNFVAGSTASLYKIS